MSQHYFRSEYQGVPIKVTMGWDRPLGYCFMVIAYECAGEEKSDDEPLYSNLDEATPFGLSLEHYRHKLAELGIVVPESLFEQVQIDRALNAGNRYVWHQADGSLREAHG